MVVVCMCGITEQQASNYEIPCMYQGPFEFIGMTPRLSDRPEYTAMLRTNRVVFQF